MNRTSGKLSLVMFTVQGVIIGGQIGPLVASRIAQHTLERWLVAPFILVAALMIGEIIQGRLLRYWCHSGQSISGRSTRTEPYPTSNRCMKRGANAHLSYHPRR